MKRTIFDNSVCRKFDSKIFRITSGISQLWALKIAHCVNELSKEVDITYHRCEVDKLQ